VYIATSFDDREDEAGTFFSSKRELGEIRT
jgi:hypothetical protein